MNSQILRKKPLLSKFNDIMRNYYNEDYDENKGLVFGFPESIHNRDKIIKDFIYWKTWGNDRNEVLNGYTDEEYIEMENIGLKIFSHLKVKADHFSILLLDIKYDPFFDYYLHKQSIDMGTFWTDMDVRYEHDDKPLTLMNYDVNINKIKKVLGTAESIITKQNKIDVSLHI